MKPGEAVWVARCPECGRPGRAVLLPDERHGWCVQHGTAPGCSLQTLPATAVQVPDRRRVMAVEDAKREADVADTGKEWPGWPDHVGRRPRWGRAGPF